LQSEGFNWTGRDFDLGKEVALYTIELLKQRIDGKRIPIIKSLVEFLKKKVPDKSFNITKGTIGGLLHVPGFFSRIGFDARITTWKSKTPEVALKELNEIREKIKNLINYNEVPQQKLLKTSSESIEFVIPEPSPKRPFIKIGDNRIIGHGQIQRKSVYHFFKKWTDSKDETFFIILKFYNHNKEKVFSDKVKVMIKKFKNYGIAAILLLRYIKNLIQNGLCNYSDFNPGNILQFSKLRDEKGFLLKIKKKVIENNSKETIILDEGEEEELEDLEDLKNITQNDVHVDEADFPIKYLIDDLKSNDIYVPEFQRHFVWNIPIASRLVESVLLGFPIPPIYLSEDSENKRQIIDGQQRLFSLQRFYDNLYSLKLGSKNRLTRKKYKGLPKNLQRVFKNYPLKVVTLKKSSNSAIKYEMFERLNRGSVKLNEQEIRNCIYRGKYMDSIKKMANYSDFINAVNYEKFKTRMQMEDIVTRFGALLHNNYKISFKGSMKNFLQKEMESHLSPSDDFINEFEIAFKKCAYLSFSIFGGNAFQRYIVSKDKTSAKWDKKPNKSLFEAIMYCFAQYDKNRIMHYKDQIYEAVLSLMTNNFRFNDLISHHTNNKDRYLERMEIMENLFHSIITTPKQPRCFSYEIKKDLYNKNDICTICGQQIIDIRDAAVDHIKEYWKGGLTIPENARLVHRWCNLKRSEN